MAVLIGFIGLVLLLAGADLIVRGGTRVATALGITPMVIGLTVVSIGTSLPELAIGIDAARNDNAGLATGNLVGTNLVNLVLILGLSAALAPVVFTGRTLRWDLPFVGAAAVLFYILARDNTLSVADGAILCLVAGLYTWSIVHTSRVDAIDMQPASVDTPATCAETGQPAGSSTRAKRRLSVPVVGLLVGVALIVVGAEMLVHGAVDLASEFGVSDAVIGLTVIAIGTSAPELVTTIVSTVRGERDLAIGNLVGSSVFNLTFVLGVTVLAAIPHSVDVPAEVVDTDLMVLLATSAVLAVLMTTGARISRLEGALLVGIYAGYLVWLLTTRT